MKLMRIFLILALLLGGTPMLSGQQSDAKDRQERADSRRNSDANSSEKDERQDDDALADSDTFEMAESLENGSRAPNAHNRGKDLVATDIVEAKALTARDEMAEHYGIRNPKDLNDLFSACRKYYRAKELLDAQYPNKESEDYRKKAQVLEREYSRELWQVLPES